MHDADRVVAGVKVPHWTEVPDHFVWEAFEERSNDTRLRLAPDALQQEALLAHTTNFYVIPDQFGVVSGHVLVLPKQPVASVAALAPSLDDELLCLLQHVSDVVATEYEAHVVIAEHGECGCATNDQAHVHVLPIPATVTPGDVRSVVDGVLRRRLVGVERILYRDAEFTALEDLRALLNRDGATVVGRLLRSSDLTVSCAFPAAAREATALARPYVYFKAPGVEFVSTYRLGSQFVREVVSRVTGLPEGSWDRRTCADRTNMFLTFTALAPALADQLGREYAFQSRSVGF